jgi:hypothetical protein
MDRWALESNFCDCFFNKTEAKQNGGWENEDDSNMAALYKDPIRCEEYCKTRFLETVSADYNETFSSVCTKLTTKGPNQDLWPLYWCDSTYCGVGIDQEVPGGQDREYPVIWCCAGSSQLLGLNTNTIPCTANVDWIINTCNK